MARKTVPTRSIPSLAPSISAEKALIRFRKLLEQAPQVRNEVINLKVWRQDIEGVLSGYYGQQSIQLEQFKDIHFSLRMFSSATPDYAFEKARLDGIATAEAFLASRIAELEDDLADSIVQGQQPTSVTAADEHKIFVVHGHDHGTKEKVARYLERLGLEPVILHEQPDQGRTIIEKFEHHADVGCAVVLLTADDVAYAKGDASKQENRARQNVIFELGYFIGKLGRKNTIALLEKGVIRPSDFDGVLYIPMEDDATWRLRIVGELKAAGMAVDANKAF
jgi:predicted nucleotide-binding protein